MIVGPVQIFVQFNDERFEERGEFPFQFRIGHKLLAALEKKKEENK